MPDDSEGEPPAATPFWRRPPGPVVLSASAILALGLVVGGYLLGSIPFGVIATRLGGAGDVRNIGSGNIGATNVLRTSRKDLAAITLLGDGGKGAVAVFIAWLLTRNAGGQAQATLTALAGASAFFGHLFPVWLKFKGGKGMATALGVLLAIAFPVGAAACATWLVVAAALRYSSLATLLSIALAPLYAWLIRGDLQLVQFAALLAVLVWIKHHENIRRLLKGQESKIGAKSRPPGESTSA